MKTQQILKRVIKEQEDRYVLGSEFVNRRVIIAELKKIQDSLPKTCAWCKDQTMYELAGNQFICQRHYEKVRQ